MKSACIDIYMLARYIEGRLSDEQKETMEEHFSVCDRCRKELVSAYCLVKESDMSEWEPASDQEVRSVLNYLNHPNHPNNSDWFKEVFEWITEKLPPGTQLQTGYAVRELGKGLSLEHIELSRKIGESEVHMYIEKTDDSKVNIRARVLKENAREQNVRLTLTRKGGGTVSRPMKRDYALFEELPFGLYRLSLKQNALEKGTCLINISEAEIGVSDDLS